MLIVLVIFHTCILTSVYIVLAMRPTKPGKIILRIWLHKLYNLQFWNSVLCSDMEVCSSMGREWKRKNVSFGRQNAQSQSQALAPLGWNLCVGASPGLRNFMVQHVDAALGLVLLGLVDPSVGVGRACCPNCLQSCIQIQSCHHSLLVFCHQLMVILLRCEPRRQHDCKHWVLVLHCSVLGQTKIEPHVQAVVGSNDQRCVVPILLG